MSARALGAQYEIPILVARQIPLELHFLRQRGGDEESRRLDGLPRNENIIADRHSAAQYARVARAPRPRLVGLAQIGVAKAPAPIVGRQVGNYPFDLGRQFFGHHSIVGIEQGNDIPRGSGATTEAGGTNLGSAACREGGWRAVSDTVV